GSILSGRTKPSRPGAVDVVATLPRGERTMAKAFLYYDPRVVTGGAWGGSIEGSVNVGVLDADTGMPVPGVTVQLGYDADPRRARLTDMNGLATISGPHIRGAFPASPAE